MPSCAPVPINANGVAHEATGVRQQHRGFKPPSQPVPGMLDKEMAEAAAKKYEKDKKKIRKAIAEIDPDVAAQQPKAAICGSCGCTIM